jgi:hypothetical protein
MWRGRIPRDARAIGLTVLLGAVLTSPTGAMADEGGVSFWIPGFFGSLAAASLPWSRLHGNAPTGQAPTGPAAGLWTRVGSSRCRPAGPLSRVNPPRLRMTGRAAPDPARTSASNFSFKVESQGNRGGAIYCALFFVSWAFCCSSLSSAASSLIVSLSSLPVNRNGTW